MWKIKQTKIQGKIIIPFLILLFSLMLVSTLSTIFISSRALTERQLVKAKMLTKNVGVAIGDPLLLGEFDRVTEIIKETKNGDKDIVYIYLIDTTGRCVSSSEGVAKDQYLNKTLFEKAALEVKELTYQIKSETINEYEIVYPIAVQGSTTGILRIGYTKHFINNVNRRILIISLILMFLGLIIGFSIYRIIIKTIITNPLKQVVHRIQKISQGEIEDPVQIKSNDEIGELSGAFNQMVKYISETAKNARQISQGELSAEITPSSDKDVLRNAFNEMLGYLREMAELAQQISKGNITGNVRLRSEKDILGIAFKEMVDYFKEVSTLAQEVSQGNININIRVRSQFDVLGNSFKQIVEYLQEMANITQEVARGEITKTFKPRSSKDVIGNALSSMIAGLRKLISNIQESSNQIYSNANEMATLSQNSSKNVSQMSSNINQISASITRISETTQNVAQLAQEAAKIAETGNDNICGVINDKVLHSKDSAYQSADQIKKLGERSIQIGEIINYITKVADQTNLLSLNAAIEAARAGDAGYGFAVVADEIRKLAEGSAQSAGEIARLIREVQEETNKAVLAVEAVAKEVGDSAVITQQTGGSFTDISQAAKTIAGQIGDIAASSEETAASAQEASASSEEQVATFEEIVASVEKLKEIAEGLKEATARFKLS